VQLKYLLLLDFLNQIIYQNQEKRLFRFEKFTRSGANNGAVQKKTPIKTSGKSSPAKHEYNRGNTTGYK